jgi:prepilin-type N-terminal cleavage/methylation domain-containing protein
MRTNNKGFTLIELIIFIIIGAIFVPASMVAFTSVMNSYSRPDYYVKAMFYADKRMAEITNNVYDNITSTLCTTPTDEGGGYTTECAVATVNSNDLSTTSSSPYYKRITVTVKYSQLLNDYVISTIVTRRPILP